MGRVDSKLRVQRARLLSSQHPAWAGTVSLGPLQRHTSSSDTFFFSFLGLHLPHIEVPGLGVESELQLLIYTKATATRDLSRICDLHHSSWRRQRGILKPLREARNRTFILMDTGWVGYHLATMGTPSSDTSLPAGPSLHHKFNVYNTQWSPGPTSLDQLPPSLL